SVFGYGASVSGTGGSAVGSGAQASNNNASVFGNDAAASGSGSTAIGFRATSNGLYAAALGSNTVASGDYSIAIGGGDPTNVNGAKAEAANSIAIGYESSASASNAIAIGRGVTAPNANTVILGNNANVGIGTNAPTAKLQVNGTLRYVDATPGNDNNKVLTSDANGNASWQPIAGIPQTVAAGLVAPNGTAIKINGATVTRINLGDYQVTFSTARDSRNYIINLATIDCMDSADCPFDDPGIAYYDRQTTGFKINIGDSDNGGTAKEDIDIEFTFSVIDF
ncbi:MAG: hypothetical protein WA951_12950, partial [Leeuwenhoekiella sp.]